VEFFDLHADIGYDVIQKRRKEETHIIEKYHLKKFREGEISFVCMACNFEGTESWWDMQEMVLALKEEIALCDEVDLVLTKDDLLENNSHIKALLTVEGMCGIKDHVAEKITWLYQQGVRIASLCWNDENELATGVKGNPLHGLKTQGKEAIETMMKLNMVLDVSHANEKTFWDIMEYPIQVMATHSNARALCNHTRNLYDDAILAIKQHHGFIGVVSAPSFVNTENDKQDIVHILEHVEHIQALIGIDRVGFGLDYMDFYEGCEDFHTKDLENAAKTQNLVCVMKERGYTEQKTAMLCCGNALRYLTEIYEKTHHGKV